MGFVRRRRKGAIVESSQALDPTRAAQAVKLGLFIDAAYQMWKNHPGVAAPPPPSQLPDGYSFAAWVQMRDFLFASGDLLFYGLIAHSPDGGNSILAIRGTQTVEEWLDNLTSLVPAPWTGTGLVGYGFNRIYQTLRVVPFEPSAVAAAPMARPPEPAAPFAQQVANVVRQAARPPLRPGEMAAPPQENSIRVAAHSLGAPSRRSTRPRTSKWGSCGSTCSAPSLRQKSAITILRRVSTS